MKIGNKAQNDACKDLGRGSCQLGQHLVTLLVFSIHTHTHTHTHTHNYSWHVGGFFHADNFGLTESLIKH